MKLPKPDEFATMNSFGCSICGSPEASQWVLDVVTAAEALGRKPNMTAMTQTLREAGMRLTRHSMRDHLNGHLPGSGA
jgi:hypothetical protein